MKVWRILRRLVLVLYMIAKGVWLGGATHIRALAQNPPDPKAVAAVHNWFREMLRDLGVHVRVVGEETPGPQLVVCNHTSWIDILVIGSIFPASFLSKEVVRHWPLIGRMTGAAGTLFIQRGATEAANQAIVQMGEKLQRQRSIAIFPEATTGDGYGVLRYYPRLFAASIEYQVPVQPVAIIYPHPDGVHPKVAFIGQMTLVGSIWGILGTERIDAEVHLGDLIHPEGLDRRQLSDRARAHAVEVVERNLRQSGVSRPAETAD